MKAVLVTIFALISNCAFADLHTSAHVTACASAINGNICDSPDVTWFLDRSTFTVAGDADMTKSYIGNANQSHSSSIARVQFDRHDLEFHALTKAASFSPGNQIGSANAYASATIDLGFTETWIAPSDGTNHAQRIELPIPIINGNISGSSSGIGSFVSSMFFGSSISQGNNIWSYKYAASFSSGSHNGFPIIVSTGPIVAQLNPGQAYTFEVSLLLNSNADSSNYTPGFLAPETNEQTAANYGETIYWGGIKATDAVTGATIPDWKPLNDSGIQWQLASPLPEPASGVPEPASGTLFCIGLALLWNFRRHHRPER